MFYGETHLKNPKLHRQNKTIYHYYAGYSDEFVEDIIKSYFSLSTKDTILDLWNGSGTTTKVAYKNNIKAYGFDINPVMKYIAEAKLVSQNDEPLLREVLRLSLSQFDNRVTKNNNPVDLLGLWLNDKSIRIIRYFEMNVNEICKLLSVSMPVISFFKVLQFRLIRFFLQKFTTSNPTWIKHNIKDIDKINITKTDVKKNIYIIFEDMVASLIDGDEINEANQLPIILTASSYQIPLANNSVDAIITSPPYCTRIDYAISTLPELAILGFSKDSIQCLRNAMIGSTTIAFDNTFVLEIPSLTAIKFLDLVKGHDSKASNSYYFKYYKKYFLQMYMSLNELERVIKPNGLCCIVIQNSFFKDVLLSLNIIIEEMMIELGFLLIDAKAFQKKSTHTNANPTSKKYRKSSVFQYEYALIFKKGEKSYD